MAEEDDIKSLSIVFQSLDKLNNGYITLETLEDAMQDYGETQFDAARIFKAIDTNCTGKIDFQDFQWAAIDIEKVLTPEKLQKAFKNFDKRKNGHVCKEDMMEIFET